MREAKKSPKPRRTSTTLAEKMKALDALTLAVYGYACRKLHNVFYFRGYADGYEKGFDDGYEKSFKDGYEQGIKSGRRLAKGKPPFPKPRGARKILDHDILVLQFIDYVDALRRKKTITLPAAVSEYRVQFKHVWRVGRKSLPSQDQLLRLYKRATKPNAIDNYWRRIYDEWRNRDSPGT